MSTLPEPLEETLREAYERLEGATELCVERDENWDPELTIGVIEVDAFLKIGEKGAVPRQYAAEVKVLLTAQTIDQAIAAARRGAAKAGKESHPLLVAGYVNPNLAQRLREEEMEFLDAAGNAYLRGPGLYVDIRGRRPETRPRPRGVGARALQLVGLLLIDPEAIGLPTRELSRRAGVSLGGVSVAMRELEERGFVRRTGPRRLALRERRGLLELWVQGYAETLRKRIGRRTYRLAPGAAVTDLPESLAEAGIGKVLVGGEAAAARYTEYLNPERATLHLFEGAGALPPRLFLPDMRGNVDVVEGFGSEPAWSGAGWRPDGERLAHPLLVYAELLAHDGRDRRIMETARLLREKFALDRDANDDSHV